MFHIGRYRCRSLAVIYLKMFRIEVMRIQNARTFRRKVRPRIRMRSGIWRLLPLHQWSVVDCYADVMFIVDVQRNHRAFDFDDRRHRDLTSAIDLQFCFTLVSICWIGDSHALCLKCVQIDVLVRACAAHSPSFPAPLYVHIPLLSAGYLLQYLQEYIPFAISHTYLRVFFGIYIKTSKAAVCRDQAEPRNWSRCLAGLCAVTIFVSNFFLWS